MNNLLDKLIKLDKEAQKLDEEIREQCESLEADIQSEAEKIKEKHMKAAEETIKKETVTLRNNAEASWNKSCGKYEVARKNLEDSFNKNFDRWVDMVVSDVLK